MPGYAIVNAILINQGKIVPSATLLIKDGRISCILDGKPHANIGYKEIDVSGRYVSSGLMDLHVHGGGGFDFMDGSVDAFLGAAEFHARHGTTSLVATFCASGISGYQKAFKAFHKAREACLESNGAQILGVHMEGPYLSHEFKGAQPEKVLKTPLENEYKHLVKSAEGSILMWSAAPELPGSLAMAAWLNGQGITVSAAHTAADFEQADLAFRSGFSSVTHSYNAMAGIRKLNSLKSGGVIEAAYLNDNIIMELIADGVHLPACLLKLAYKIKGPGKICLVTDAIRAAGWEGKGRIRLGNSRRGTPVRVENGAAWLKDSPTLAGSTATAETLLRVMSREAEAPLEDVCRMMSTTPASVIRSREKKGALKTGKDADLTVFDSQFNTLMTMVKGRIVYDIL